MSNLSNKVPVVFETHCIVSICFQIFACLLLSIMTFQTVNGEAIPEADPQRNGGHHRGGGGYGGGNYGGGYHGRGGYGRGRGECNMETNVI